MKKLLIATVLLFTPTAACSGLDDYEPRNGDIVFQVSRSAQSHAIQVVTDSPYSHMGIVRLEDDQAWVFEAVGPVKSTPLDTWIERGLGGHVVVKRLTSAENLLDANAIDRMLAAGHELVGRPYDLRFEWSDDRVYCSELVWKVYHRALGIELSELERLGDFDFDHPEVRHIVNERWNGAPPADHPVVSPAAIFASPYLVTVYEN